MKNFEALGMKEMTQDELMNVEGGFIEMVAAAVCGAIVYACMDDPAGVWRGFSKSMGF